MDDGPQTDGPISHEAGCYKGSTTFQVAVGKICKYSKYRPKLVKLHPWNSTNWNSKIDIFERKYLFPDHHMFTNYSCIIYGYWYMFHFECLLKLHKLETVYRRFDLSQQSIPRTPVPSRSWYEPHAPRKAINFEKLHSLKLTAKALENKPSQGDGSLATINFQVLC